MAILNQDHILTFDHDREGNLYEFDLYPHATATPINNQNLEQQMKGDLLAYVQTALTGLAQNSTGTH